MLWCACPRRAWQAEQPLHVFSLLWRGTCASPAPSWLAETRAGTTSMEQVSKKSKNPRSGCLPICKRLCGDNSPLGLSCAGWALLGHRSMQGAPALLFFCPPFFFFVPFSVFIKKPVRLGGLRCTRERACTSTGPGTRGHAGISPEIMSENETRSSAGQTGRAATLFFPLSV